MTKHFVPLNLKLIWWPHLWRTPLLAEGHLRRGFHEWPWQRSCRRLFLSEFRLLLENCRHRQWCHPKTKQNKKGLESFFLLFLEELKIAPWRHSNHLQLTTMMAIRPPTSPTTVIGGFSLGISTMQEKKKWEKTIENKREKNKQNRLSEFAEVRFSHGISRLGWMAPMFLTVGGEWRPSTRSDSASWASPWITAMPSRNLSANDWAL